MKRLLAMLLLVALVLTMVPAITPTASAEQVTDLVWQQGTYYASLNTSVKIRRYTVIPCQEGEIYTLKFPSDNWAVYAHFADAQGDFGKEYLLRTGKPLDIVVREMDGRVPTEIRLTTFNRTNTNLVLDDANFASFDVTVTKTTKPDNDLLWAAAWNQGTPVNPSTGLRKHTLIPCQVGDSFNFSFVSTYWDVYVLPADENGPLTDDDVYFSKNGTYTAVPVNGKDPTCFYVVTVPDPQGTTITDLIWDSFSVSCVKEVREGGIEGNTFTFATQNFGLWNDGVTQGVAADKVEARAAAWQQEMVNHDIDILVGQEWQPYLDSNKTVDANEKVFGGMYPYMYGNNTSTYDGKNIISRSPLLNISYTAQVSNVGRRYAKAYTVIGGKTVCIINAHLSFEEDINTNRKEEMVELLNAAQGEKYVVIAGDFNVFTPDEFEIFEEAGYSLANCGAFGEWNTWPNLGRNPNADVNRVLDNIIVSPGIKINNAYSYDHRLSDHAMVVAELELLEEGEFTDNRLQCEHCNQFVTWTPITATNGSQADAIRESGHYYLPKDLPGVNSQFWIGVLNEATPDVVIDLRGHAVKSSARAFYVRKGSKLTIVDTVGCGTITAAGTGTGGLAYVENSAAFNIYDGSFYSTGNPTTDRKGGTLYLETSATMDIYGGEIYGGKASSGGAICGGNKNTVNVYGGLITGGQGGSGGGLYMYNGVTRLLGGTITGNSGTYGGNIHIAGSESANAGLTLGNCVITNGTASSAGNDIYVSSSGRMHVLKEFTGVANAFIYAGHFEGTNPGDALKDSMITAEGHFTGKLFLDSISGKPQACGADGETKLYIASAALVDANMNKTMYAHNASAVAHYGDAVCLCPAAGSLELKGGSYTVDLGGKNIAITGSGSVTCFDSSNDDYKTYGTATVTGATLTNETVTDVLGKQYVALNEDGVWSFHRIEMEITGVALRPSVNGFYYTSAWQMDEKLAANTYRAGVAVSVDGAPTPELMAQDKLIWTAYSAAQLQSGAPVTGVMIENVFKPGEAYNDVRGRTSVFAAPYLALADGTILLGDSVNYSLYDVVKLLDEKAYTQNAEALNAFYAKWEDILSAWELKNMK
ncbi:MAG: endonuclease/exonuclease/phosphatase family protein [Oscillospiraceae bacterium]|nr:endonuclease/exonuclease/phosphatase family protein [Oscillospiraceae bacterium]